MQQRLTRDDVPAFMYLMAQIDKKIDNEEDAVDNKFRHIAERTHDNSNLKTSKKTIRRAFTLYDYLQDEHIEKKHYGKPSFMTLNVLSSFYDSKKEALVINTFKFSTFKKRYHTEILEFYDINKPYDGILDIIFAEVPKKQNILEDYEEELIALAEEVKNSSLKGFIKDWASDNLRHDIDYDKLKSNLIDFIEKRIEQVEKKRKRVTFINRLFGAFGLFFIQTPQYNDLKTYVVDAFTEQYDDFEVDDFDDDDDFDDN